MMSDIDILNKMIKDTAKIQPEDHYGKPMVTLTEPQHQNSSAIISSMPNNAIIIKVDAFKSPDAIFNCLNGECKRSDFVIIADTGNKKVILHIELKAAKGGSANDITKQLKGGDCFVEYCRNIGKEFWKKPNFLEDYKKRFVSIGHTRIPKQRTRINRNPGDHNIPERRLIIDSPHRLEFNHLAGT